MSGGLEPPIFGGVAEDARIRHQLEQMSAALRDLAPVVARMRDNLMEEGYTREEAVEGSFRVLDALVGHYDPDA